MQGHVIRYESKKLNEHEKRYVTHDLEIITHCTCLEDMETLFSWKKVCIDDIPLWNKVFF